MTAGPPESSLRDPIFEGSEGFQGQASEAWGEDGGREKGEGVGEMEGERGGKSRANGREKERVEKVLGNSFQALNLVGEKGELTEETSGKVLEIDGQTVEDWEEMV